MNLGQNVSRDKILSSKMGHVESKIMLQGQILEKLCVRSRDHIFYSILLKFGDNVWYDEFLDRFQYGLYQINNKQV